MPWSMSKMNVARNEKRKKLHGFSYYKNIANFEAFWRDKNFSKNLLFLGSGAAIIFFSATDHTLDRRHHEARWMISKADSSFRFCPNTSQSRHCGFRLEIWDFWLECSQPRNWQDLLAVMKYMARDYLIEKHGWHL